LPTIIAAEFATFSRFTDSDPEVHRRPLVIGVETIFSRDQHIVDEWWRGEIEEAELRQRNRFDFDWGTTGPRFTNCLTAARDHGADSNGLDCMPREDCANGARDRTLPTRLLKFATGIPMPLVLYCRGITFARAIYPRRFESGFPKRACSRRCRTLTRCIGAQRANHPITCKSVRPSPRMCVRIPMPRHWRSTKLIVSISTAGTRRTGAIDLRPVCNLIDGLVRFLGIILLASQLTQPPATCGPDAGSVFRLGCALATVAFAQGILAQQRRAMLQCASTIAQCLSPAAQCVLYSQVSHDVAAEDAARFLASWHAGMPIASTAKYLRHESRGTGFSRPRLKNASGLFRIADPLSGAGRHSVTPTCGLYTN